MDKRWFVKWVFTLIVALAFFFLGSLLIMWILAFGGVKITYPGSMLLYVVIALVMDFVLLEKKFRKNFLG